MRKTPLNNAEIIAEINEANLSFLMLAQSLIRSDPEQALYRLGITEEIASTLAMLTPAQMMKLARSESPLCTFRNSDERVWGLLAGQGKAAANEGLSHIHAAILTAGQHQLAA